MPHWRKTSWAIAVWTGLIALWAISALVSVSGIEATSEAAQTGVAVGTTIGLTFVAIVWLLGLVPLALLWFGTRPR